jgi:hypothetical protein
MKGLLKVWVWDYKREKYSLAFRDIEIDVVPPKGSQLRDSLISFKVHDVVFDIPARSFEVICIFVDNGDSPTSYETQLKILEDKLKYKIEVVGTNGDDIIFREYCFPEESLTGIYGMDETMKKVSRKVMKNEEHIKFSIILSWVSIIGIAVIAARVL